MTIENSILNYSTLQKEALDLNSLFLYTKNTSNKF